MNHVQELYEAIEEMFMRTDPADYQTEMRLTADVDIAGEKKMNNENQLGMFRRIKYNGLIKK